MPLPFAALAGWMLIIGLIAALTACGERHATEPGARQSSASDAKALNLFIWPDYLAPETLADFERKTGIRTKVLVFDTNETLENQIAGRQQRF